MNVNANQKLARLEAEFNDVICGRTKLGDASKEVQDFSKVYFGALETYRKKHPLNTPNDFIKGGEYAQKIAAKYLVKMVSHEKA